MSTRGWAVVAAVVAVLLVPFVQALFWEAEGEGQVPFRDDFERAEVGPEYTWFFDAWPPRIEDGRLVVGPVQNNPVWLKVPLPDAVAIEFDVRSLGRNGDIKVEAFGNGRDHQSGYVFILGGWDNTTSVLARLDEHGADRKARDDLKVQQDRDYHMRIERRDGAIRWFVDGQPFLTYEDPHLLTGRHHDRFGFSAWETPLAFDNLVVTPL